jgi:hypothetical protein
MVLQLPLLRCLKFYRLYEDGAKECSSNLSRLTSKLSGRHQRFNLDTQTPIRLTYKAALNRLREHP